MTTMEICSKAFAFVRSLLFARVISQSNQFEIQIGRPLARSLAPLPQPAALSVARLWSGLVRSFRIKPNDLSSDTAAIIFGGGGGGETGANEPTRPLAAAC